MDQHGALLASGSDDYTVGLWDLAEGHSRPAFLKHTNAVLAVALSPDGRWAASGGRDGIVRLWSVATRRLEAELPGHREDVRAVAFSPDGTLLASCSRQDGTARLWDVAQRKAWERVPVLTHGGNVRDVAFDPKGRWLATAGSFLMAGTNADANAVKLWDLATRQPKGPPLTPRGFFSSVRFSPDGQYLAAGEYKGTIDLWEVQSGRLKARLLGHSDEVLGLDFSPRGRLLASGSADHTIILWDVESTNLLLKLEGHAGTVSSVVFTPDGRLITGSEDTTIRIWNIEAALRRPLDYASFLNSFDLEGRKVTWKFLGNNPDTPHPGPLPSEGRGRSASDMPMKPFTTNSLISVLQSGLPEEELGRALFNRFLRAGNLSSACLILERHPPQGWTKEAEVLGLAYLREAKHVLDYEGYLLAAQHAARARDCLPAKAAQAWHLSALAERGLKRWPESLAAVEQAIALEPTNAEFWHDKATILEAQDQKPAAREALSRALDLARQADANDPRLETWRQHLELLNR